MKIIFAGTPDFSATALTSLLENPAHQVIAVFTQPDRPAGRGRKLTASPVKELALLHHIPVYQPQSLKQAEDQEIIEKLNADIMVVVAYGVILPKKVLATPLYGCINIHASLLPRWRGAAPIQRAILAGDQQTGITIMQMDEGLDTGDMLLTKTLEIGDNESAEKLHDRLAILGAQALTEALTKLAGHQLAANKQQNDLATYAHKLNKQEAKVDWCDDAKMIKQKVNAFNSWPVAYCFDEKDKEQKFPIRIWQANTVDENKDGGINEVLTGQVVDESKQGIVVKCGKGYLVITELQMANKKRTLSKDFINSHSLKQHRLC